MHMCILASNNRTTDGSYANEKSLTSRVCILASIGTSSFLCYTRMIHTTTTKVRLLATLSTRLLVVCILASCMDSDSFVRAEHVQRVDSS